MPGTGHGSGTLHERESARLKPRLRGVSHQYAFIAAVALGIVVAFEGHRTRTHVAAAVFACSVAAMFGASALYHRITWSPARRSWMRKLDHTMLYGLIAGTYTPFGLLVLTGEWRIVVLAIVWSGALAAVLLKFAWVSAPKWVAATIGIALGWVGVVVFPQLLNRVGLAGALLLLLGGLLYTVGAIIYAKRKPDPFPGTFGYHEVFHALVIAAVACHYAAIAFFVLPHY